MPTHIPREKLHQAIIEAAAKEIYERGLFGLSLRSLASDLGISHVGIKYHFESLDELLAETFDYLESQMVEWMDVDVDDPQAPLQIVRNLLRFQHLNPTVAVARLRFIFEAMAGREMTDWPLTVATVSRSLQREEEGFQQLCYYLMDEFLESLERISLLTPGEPPASMRYLVLGLQMQMLNVNSPFIWLDFEIVLRDNFDLPQRFRNPNGGEARGVMKMGKRDLSDHSLWYLNVEALKDNGSIDSDIRAVREHYYAHLAHCPMSVFNCHRVNGTQICASSDRQLRDLYLFAINNVEAVGQMSPSLWAIAKGTNVTQNILNYRFNSTRNFQLSTVRFAEISMWLTDELIGRMEPDNFYAWVYNVINAIRDHRDLAVYLLRIRYSSFFPGHPLREHNLWQHRQLFELAIKSLADLNEEMNFPVDLQTAFPRLYTAYLMGIMSSFAMDPQIPLELLAMEILSRLDRNPLRHS